MESFLIKNRSRFKIDSHIILGLNVKAIKCNKQMASLQNRHELLKARQATLTKITFTLWKIPQIQSKWLYFVEAGETNCSKGLYN